MGTAALAQVNGARDALRWKKACVSTSFFLYCLICISSRGSFGAAGERSMAAPLAACCATAAMGVGRCALALVRRVDLDV